MSEALANSEPELSLFVDREVLWQASSFYQNTLLYLVFQIFQKS